MARPSNQYVCQCLWCSIQYDWLCDLNWMVVSAVFSQLFGHFWTFWFDLRLCHAVAMHPEFFRGWGIHGIHKRGNSSYKCYSCYSQWRGGSEESKQYGERMEHRAGKALETPEVVQHGIRILEVEPQGRNRVQRMDWFIIFYNEFIMISIDFYWFTVCRYEVMLCWKCSMHQKNNGTTILRTWTYGGVCDTMLILGNCWRHQSAVLTFQVLWSLFMFCAGRISVSRRNSVALWRVPSTWPRGKEPKSWWNVQVCIKKIWLRMRPGDILHHNCHQTLVGLWSFMIFLTLWGKWLRI